MYEIDKEKFGGFVARLRKEQGMTQRELAQRVYVSDKAVSKWERGLSMPDITLLIPLARELDITVTELLECERLEQAAMDSGQVETLVQRVITYSEETPVERQERRRQEAVLYGASLAVVVLELAGLRVVEQGWAYICLNLLTYEALSFAFAACFFFTRDRLPPYYDEYEVSHYDDRFFQLSLPGVSFNNRNWPYIKRSAIRGMLISAMVMPALYFLCVLLLPHVVHMAFWGIYMPLFFLSIFGPMYGAAKKHK